MALKLVETTEKSKKPQIPSLSNLSIETDENKAEIISTKYDYGQVVNKEYSDKMGQRDNIKIPEWMEKDAPIPDHVKNLKCEKITFPKQYYKGSRWMVLIRNVLTKQECDELIQFSEKHGFEEALVNIGYGRQKKMPEFRNCKRMMVDNFDMVNCLWSRVHQFIPTYFGQRKKISFNERLRFLRYHKGEFFAPHYDGTYRRQNGEISKITFLVYLNNAFQGGQTRFLQPFNEENYHAPTIEPGMVVMFQHDMFHEGAILESGTKYIVRTDVMFTKKKFNMKKISNDPDNIQIEYVKYTGFDDKNKNEDNDEEKNENEEIIL